MATTSSVTGIGASQDQFLQLLVAQLQNQDPLQPVDSQSFITQLSQLQTVQGLNSLNTSFDQVLKLQQLTQGADLIGKTVTFTPADGGTAQTGKVSAVTTNSDGSYALQIGSTQVALDQVTQVTN
ncbi:MAG TPA: flagellar hook capping FlgD N-terminal domain-containing protein [Urbifossiella sp.]|jgi:flagellar basal-body rod modification protein FlgD|nr:flagellar hook capping FlgD N-terminal domain-containing protein [Urbifossiella sp.]